MRADERRILWTASVAHGTIHVYELAVPALLLPIQREFGAGDFELGRVVTLYSLLFGAGALPAGWLVDRLGARALLLTCLWGASAALAGMAASPTLPTFTAAAALMGLALSIYHPAGTALITHAMESSGGVFARHGMVGNLGVAGSAVIAGTLGAVFGWRTALVVLAAGGALLGLTLVRLPLPAVSEVRSRTGRGDARAFALLLVSIVFLGTVYRGVTTFLPKFFATQLEGDAAATAWGGAATTAALLVGLAGMYTAGRLADSGMRPVRVFLIGAVFQIPFLVGMGWAGGFLLLPLAMGMGFFHFFTQPPGNQMVAAFTPPRLRGLGYGLYFFLSFGVGSFGAALGGWVSETVGLAYTFPVLAAVLAPALVAIALLSARRGRAPGEAPATPAR